MRLDINDNFVLRTVESDHDVRRVADFNSTLHSDTDRPDPRIGVWVTDLLTPGRHPTLAWDDYFMVEDKASGEIVSSLCIIPQTWTYGGVPFDVGRIELVGTLKDYRRRGLVRAQFEAAHRRCAEQGHLVQGITGIPYYYRQFGYEYALDLGGGLIVSFESFPDKQHDTPFVLREWRPADLPRLEALYAGFTRDRLVVCPRPTGHWLYRYDTTGEQSVQKRWLHVITRAESVIGYVSVPVDTWEPRARIGEMVLGAGLPEVVPWLMPRLREEIARVFPQIFPQADPPPNRQLYLNLGSRHPIYPYLRDYPSVRRAPYAWYMRVPDPAAFMRHIAPALERRIAGGPLAGLSRSLVLDFYTGGLRLDFERGRLAAAENLPPGVEGAGAGFPPLVFLQLLFGYRSLKQLRRCWPDVFCDSDVFPVMDGLFPRRLSWADGCLD
jgi:GNAT superfamily N-acetyltransferase